MTLRVGQFSMQILGPVSVQINNENLQPLRGDIKTQTHNVLEAISESLKVCGSNLSEVVRVTVWLSDIGLMGEFNEVYREYFGSALPTRSTVQAKLANDVDIEIEVQAWSPQC